MRQFAGVILTKPDGSVLAQHRDSKPRFGPNTWAVPGGVQEWKDLITQRTAARELKEETGYELPFWKLFRLTHDTYRTESGLLVRRTIYVSEYDGRQPIECHEGKEIRFISPEEQLEIKEDGKFYTGHDKFFESASEWGRRR